MPLCKLIFAFPADRLREGCALRVAFLHLSCLITRLISFMKSISPEARRLVLSAAPDFAQAVKHARVKNRRNAIQTSLVTEFCSFDEDFMLLYACLWYATSAGVAVTIQPQCRMTEIQREQTKTQSGQDSDGVQAR
jgi:hypothetical protein